MGRCRQFRVWFLLGEFNLVSVDYQQILIGILKLRFRPVENILQSSMSVGKIRP